MPSSLAISSMQMETASPTVAIAKTAVSPYLTSSPTLYPSSSLVSSPTSLLFPSISFEDCNEINLSNSSTISRNEGSDSGIAEMLNSGLKISEISEVDEQNEENKLDVAARLHRVSASLTDTDYKWSGVLTKSELLLTKSYSLKIFIGGLPWDTRESILIESFKRFGSVRIEWPGKDNMVTQPKGFAYVILENEFRVKELLKMCTDDTLDPTKKFFRIPTIRKSIEIVPWPINDSNYQESINEKPDGANTVFVGALHGLLTAQHLAQIMNDLFGSVVFACLDTDRYRYPIGSGRVVFSEKLSYMKAVSAGYVEIKTDKFSKKIQIDPYLQEKLCSKCSVRPGLYFCRQVSCFNYFCLKCWKNFHDQRFDDHQPIMRKFR